MSIRIENIVSKEDYYPEYKTTMEEEWLINKDWAAIEQALPYGRFDTWGNVRRNLILLQAPSLEYPRRSLEQVLFYINQLNQQSRMRFYERMITYWFYRIKRGMELFYLHPIRLYEIPHGWMDRVRKSPFWDKHCPQWCGEPAPFIQAMYARIKAVGNLLVIPVHTTKSTDKQWCVMLRPAYKENGLHLTENHYSLAFDTCLVQAKNIKSDFVGWWGTFSLHLSYDELLTPQPSQRIWKSRANFKNTYSWTNEAPNIFTVAQGRDYCRIGQASWCISQFWKALIKAEKAKFMHQLMLGALPSNPSSSIKKMTDSWLYERQVWRLIGDFLTG